MYHHDPLLTFVAQERSKGLLEEDRRCFTRWLVETGRLFP
jgi:hypothetical protein